MSNNVPPDNQTILISIATTSNSPNLETAPVIMSNNNAGSFPRRTMESALQLRDNFNNVIREIQPLVETARTVNVGMQNAISISGLIHRVSETGQTRQNNPSVNNGESIVINLEEGTANQNNAPPHRDVQNEGPGFLGNPPATNPEPNEDDADRLQATVHAQEILHVILKYIPFVLILLAKSVYDYHNGMFILIILFSTFAHANSTVKREATKRQRRSLYNLSLEMLYIAACLLFIHFIFESELHSFSNVLNLVLIRTFTHPLTVWNLLWVVTITDFILKLITIFVKICLTMLPEKIVAFQKRGKIYLFIEASSQMYRSTATIQPWLYYLLESYQGSEKIVAVFLSAFYMISKGPDLMSRLVLLKKAFFKLPQNVAVGSSPSKEQIQTAGEHCPICHDEYNTPVLLQCRHIFCESCVTTWFDREQTCPLCRAKIVDDPSWRDGSTTYFIQVF